MGGVRWMGLKKGMKAVMKRKSEKPYWSKPQTFFCVSVALTVFPVLASTYIVSTPAGDRDPHHSRSSASVSVDAGAGTVALIDAALNGAVNTTVAAGHARRDGAWNNPAKYQRMAVRASNEPAGQFNSVGLRLACRVGLR